MADDAPPVLRLSQKRAARVQGKPALRVKSSEQYSGFSEYFAAEIEPRQRDRANHSPPVNLAYPQMKRRR